MNWVSIVEVFGRWQIRLLRSNDNAEPNASNYVIICELDSEREALVAYQYVNDWIDDVLDSVLLSVVEKYVDEAMASHPLVKATAVPIDEVSEEDKANRIIPGMTLSIHQGPDVRISGTIDLLPGDYLPEGEDSSLDGLIKDMRDVKDGWTK